MERYQEYMRNCDVVVNASLKEGAVTVSFDSMAMGKPLICIDTTGYTRYFSPEYAEIIQRKDRESTIQGLADSMMKLTDAHTRYEMGKRHNWQVTNLRGRTGERKFLPPLQKL